MKKNNLIIIGISVLTLAFTACKKEECHECHYEKNGQEVELGEKCGDDLEAIEASGYNDGGTVYDVHCHEH